MDTIVTSQIRIEPVGDMGHKRCPGCERHCPCPSLKSPEPPDCQLLMVDFVQLHLPENIWDVLVKLPIKFLVSQQNGVRSKIKAKFQFFDEDMRRRAERDLAGMYPSMDTYRLMRDAIIEKYLHTIRGWNGKYIVKEEVPAFEYGVDDFKKMLAAMGENLRKLLRKYKDEAIGHLYRELNEHWRKLGIKWVGEDGLFKRDPEEEFRSIMSGEIDRWIAQYKPAIRYPYFELPMSMRIDPNFRVAVEKEFGEWLSKNARTLNWLLGTPCMPDKTKIDTITFEETDGLDDVVS